MKGARREVKFAVKRTIVDFLENTSIHGLKYTIEDNTSACERVFWGLAICAMMMSSVYLTILHLRRFVENPTRSTIITFHGPVDLVPFPAVTICNSNLILHSKMNNFVESLNLQEDEKHFLLEKIPQLLGYFMFADYNASDLVKMDLILAKSGYDDVLTVLRKIAPRCEEMLLQCVWNGEASDCSRIFEESLTFDGICCSFNYYGSRIDFQPNYTIFTGWKSGLSVIMNSLQQKVLHSTVTSSGFKVAIHNSMEYPGFGRTYKTVSEGLSYFQLSAEKLTNTQDVMYLTKEQRKCVFSGERLMKYHHTYHFSNCVAKTYSRFISKFCGCVPFYFSFSHRPKCSISQMECFQRYIRGK